MDAPPLVCSALDVPGGTAVVGARRLRVQVHGAWRLFTLSEGWTSALLTVQATWAEYHK